MTSMLLPTSHRLLGRLMLARSKLSTGQILLCTSRYSTVISSALPSSTADVKTHGGRFYGTLPGLSKTCHATTIRTLVTDTAPAKSKTGTKRKTTVKKKTAGKKKTSAKKTTTGRKNVSKTKTTRSSKTQKTTKTKKKPKNAMSEKQKAALVRKKERDHVRNLKLTALSPPKELPTSGYILFMMKFIENHKGEVGEAGETRKQPAMITEAAKAYRSISSEEKAAYAAQGLKNAETNRELLAKFVLQYKPDEIRKANVARAALRRRNHKVRTWKALDDSRLVKAPRQAHVFYMTERMGSGDFMKVLAKDAMSAISKEWAGLSDEDKQRFKDMAEKDKARYHTEVKEVYQRT